MGPHNNLPHLNLEGFGFLEFPSKNVFNLDPVGPQTAWNSIILLPLWKRVSENLFSEGFLAMFV